MRLKSLLSLTLILTSLLTLVPPPSRARVTQDGEQADDDTAQRGLQFRLAGGKEKAERPAPHTVAVAAPLPKTETERLLARLPPVSREAGDVQDFKLRESSLPPPRAGQTIQAAFAQPEQGGPSAPSKTGAPLEVLRFAPEGEVELAPALNITFSQPMVAVSAQEEAAASVPVKLTPQPAGRWRWVSAQTLVFQPEAEGGRMPMATDYKVSVRAGAKSAAGNALAEEKSFSFSTPPPTLKRFYPDAVGVSRDALMFMEFDQRIDAARVLEMLKPQPEGSFRLRLATREEIAADSYVSELVKQSQEGRWLALRAVKAGGETKDALPGNTTINVVVPPGTPSMEGPRTTASQQGLSFKTYGPLRVTSTNCGYDKRCSPFDLINLELSNQLDQKSFSPSLVSVSPEIPGMKVTGVGSSILIEGVKRSTTVYTVTLSRSIQDIFGQTLSGDDKVMFNVTTPEPRLFTDSDGFVVLDPAAGRSFNVYSINYRKLKVELYRVGPEDWQQYRRYIWSRRVGGEKTPPPPPGRLALERVAEIKATPDELVQTSIDLAPALSKGYGQAFVRVTPLAEPGDPVRVYAYRNPDGSVESWVEATDIGLDAFVDKGTLVAWANSLKDGSPLADVQLSVWPENLSAATGADGVAHFPLDGSVKTDENRPAVIVARRGDDVAMLPQSFSPYTGGAENARWRRGDSYSTVAWYVFDDRKMYRPGEEVTVKGWLRQIDTTPTGDTGMYVPEEGETLYYVLKDSANNEVAKGTAKLNALAGFDLKLKLPPTMHLGEASIKFELTSYDGEDTDDYDDFTHHFQVQEFRRPEFELTARSSEAPHFVGASATATAEARYYAGGGLAETEVEWTVSAVPTNYTPPNRDDYTFGKFVPWWFDYGGGGGESTSKTFKGRTDSEGRHVLKLDFDSVSPARPSSVLAEARVQDVNRQTLAAVTTMLVHPADVYVGLRPARTFVQKGEAFDLSVIATDLDGQALAGRDVNLRLVRLDYVNEAGEWKQKEVDAQEQTLKSGADAVRVRWPVREGGAYRLTARVRDDRERLNETQLSLWVAGGKLPPNREVKQERADLIPDRKTYKGGDVAEILVQSPFAPAEGVITVRRSGLLRTERFRMDENSYTLRVPVEEAMTPNVHVQVDLVGASVRVDDQGKERADLPKRPAFASGEINLEVPPDTRRLSVKATPRATVLEPGKETLVDVEVKDAQGRAVQGTETAVVVVDEAVLALTNYRLGDPLRVFYYGRDADTSDYHLREQVKLSDPDQLVREGGGGPGGGGGVDYTRSFRTLQALGSYDRSVNASYAMETVNVTSESASGEGEAQIKLRQNFSALAVFAASLPTDAAGRARVRVKLPDNLTRYRVMAVSVAGGKLAGMGESAITARLPLMARPSAPRFLNFGDRAELPVVLQNQTDRALSVSVAVRATNAELTEGAGRRVSVPAHDRVEVRFPVAAVKPGTARFQVAASSGASRDAAEISLPVYTPATTEAFATYGVIDEGAVAQPVKAPADAVRDFGGLEVTTASTQLQELTDAFIYLYSYPFSCSEQIASRVISVAALKDVLAAFKTKDLPTPEEMRASVAADIKRLQSLQNDDGGFDFWQKGKPSVPFVSVHVAHALVRAKAKGFDVPEEILEKAHGFLRDINSKIPNEYSPDAKRAIQAYALYVRALTNDRDTAGARRLIANAGGVEKLSLESLGWLLPVLSGDAASANESDAIRRHLNNRVTETAGAAHFADRYNDGAYTTLQSDRRADGVLLDALIGDRPASDLIPKLVRGLLDGRRRGRWSNTQENVFILLALDRYFQTYEKATPDFVARVWLGGAFAGEKAFKGRSVDRQQLNLPMSALAERTAGAPADLTIGKEGVGRLYFRVGTRYAPSNLKLEAADYGFRVERVYEAVDDPRDVKRDAEGVWHVRAGARVRVRVRMLNPARRYHVALVDPLPAGLEALNPELATTERLPDASSEAGVYRSGRGVINYYWFGRGPWYEHQNLRDERVEAFTSLLWEGEHEYSYFARATTPGLYVVPPAKAEEMYAPETFGRGQTDRVRVE